MAQEFETRVLDINTGEMQRKLRALGAKEEPEVLLRRYVFDINPAADEFVRVRDNGKNITITYKCKKGSGISETEEIEVITNDFDKAVELCSKLNFKGKYYQENKRHVFHLNSVEFSIDSWPRIPPFLEIEASSEEKVKEALKWLELENQDIGNPTIKSVYARYRIDLHTIIDLRF